MSQALSENRMRPFVKWPGGKDGELPVIFRYMPTEIGRFFEPFVGGGAVSLALENDKTYINDKSADLISVYRAVATQPSELAKCLKGIYRVFTDMEAVVRDGNERLSDMRRDAHSGRAVKEQATGLVDDYLQSRVGRIPDYLETEGHLREELIRCLDAKIRRMVKLEQKQGMLCEQDQMDNYECGLKGGVYMATRRIYNAGVGGNVSSIVYASSFYFVREFCYSSMFRYNAKGEFNVPYGGISYNRKDFASKIAYLTSDRLSQYIQTLTIGEEDFGEFLDAHTPEPGDFIFVDPPYDSEFSTYDQNTFDCNDQRRLAQWLADTDANVMVVIKRTDFIYDLYESLGFHIASFDKKYQVSFKDRNDRKVTHLLITNYEIGESA